MKALIKALILDEKGTSAVEMGLICSLIILAMLTALQGFANETQNTWTNVSTSMQNAVSGATGA